MDALFGTTMPLAARFFIAFLVVLALIGVTAWLVRRFGANRLGAASRGRQPRLAVIDAASVDGRRRLVLIRRDNTEHLLMIGGPTDVVIEPNIVRASVAREPGRLSTSLDAGARVGAAPPPEPAWQPPLSELPAPAAPPPPRGFRAPATEEPWLPPEPGGRARPSESLTGLAAEFSAKLHSPEVAVPQPRHEPPAPARHEPPAPARHEPAAAARIEPLAPPRTVAPPVTPEQPTAMAPPAPQNDHNLAEMAQQLEAALRRAPAPEGRPPVTDPLVTPPPAKPVAPQGAPRDIKPKPDAKREAKFEPPTIERRPEQRIESKPEAKPEPKFDPKFDAKPEPKFEFRPERRPEPAGTTPSKTIYDNLEEEMASLLGRPPDKS